MHIQVVNFNLKGMSDAEFVSMCDEPFARTFASVPGLISKVWLRGLETNTYGGVYTWRDRRAMEDFRRSDLFQMVVNNPNFTNIMSRDFGVMEGPTRVTNGLAGVKI